LAARDFIRLMRPHQWYKNFLVYLAVVFAGTPGTWPWTTIPYVFVWTNYIPLTLGFLTFCAISSSGYIMNDIKDLEEDAAHPEKKNRPLPSGAVSKGAAFALSAILMTAGLVTAWLLDPLFFLIVLVYIGNSQAYNFYLRKWAVIDVVTIAFGFILRAVSGAFLIRVQFTSWLVIGVFFVALVLGFGKRKNELQLLGQNAAAHKNVLQQYSESMLDQGITMSATWVVLFYALYTYENFRLTMETQPVMWTVPIVAGIVMRYVYLIQSGSPVGRKPHLAVKDKGMLGGLILFLVVLLWTLFFWQPVFEFFVHLLP